MLTVTFQVAGEGQYVRAFELYERALPDMRDPLGQVADHFVHVVGEQFLTKGAHGLGHRWTMLSPEYEAWKDAHYPGMPILVATGDMRYAYLVEGTRELTEDRLVWGITDQRDRHGNLIADRAEGHQTGRGVNPQRKIIALASMDRRAIDRIFVEWLHHLRTTLIRGAAPA